MCIRRNLFSFNIFMATRQINFLMTPYSDSGMLLSLQLTKYIRGPIPQTRPQNVERRDQNSLIALILNMNQSVKRLGNPMSTENAGAIRIRLVGAPRAALLHLRIIFRTSQATKTVALQPLRCISDLVLGALGVCLRPSRGMSEEWAMSHPRAEISMKVITMIVSVRVNQSSTILIGIVLTWAI